MNFKVCSNLDTWERSRDTLRMCALGQKRTFSKISAMSALPPKADIGTQPCDVCFVPKADIGTFVQRMGGRRNWLICVRSKPSHRSAPKKGTRPRGELLQKRSLGNDCVINA